MPLHFRFGIIFENEGAGILTIKCHTRRKLLHSCSYVASDTTPCGLIVEDPKVDQDAITEERDWFASAETSHGAGVSSRLQRL